MSREMIVRVPAGVELVTARWLSILGHCILVLAGFFV
jgi:hypothetical protein